jgi:hypothetical protein
VAVIRFLAPRARSHATLEPKDSSGKNTYHDRVNSVCLTLPWDPSWCEIVASVSFPSNGRWAVCTSRPVCTSRSTSST